MEYSKKESSAETSQCYYPKLPLSERQTQNTPFVSQIQELLSVLVQKKSELKEGKLKQANLKGKQQQQEMRINKINIAIEHQIEKQKLVRSQQERLQCEINSQKQQIKQLSKKIKGRKSQLGELLENIILEKKNKIDIQNRCGQLTSHINAITEQNAKLDQHIQNLQTLILSMQNDVRSKQDELSSLQIEKSQLCALLDYLQQKLRTAIKTKNSALGENSQLSKSITKSQHRLYNLKKQTGDIQWNCQQLKIQNNQIDEVNQKLSVDLENVRKHLATMQRMNELLQDSLAQYGITGQKVTRMINSVKTY